MGPHLDFFNQFRKNTSSSIKQLAKFQFAATTDMTSPQVNISSMGQIQ